MHLSETTSGRIRGTFFPGLLAVAFALAIPQTRAASPAENFVSVNVQKGFALLNNHGLTQADKQAQFRDFLTSLTDMRRIALFTLGPARRTAPPTDINDYVDAFHEFAVAVYELRLSLYSGQTLKVTNSTERAPGDYIVSTTMADPNAQNTQQSLPIDFRVEDENGKFVVIDVSVLGIWLAIEERDQFTAFLDQNNGSVPALVSHLQQLTQQMRNGSPPPSRPG